MITKKLLLFFIVLSFCVLYPGIGYASEESSLDRLTRRIAELMKAARYKEAIPLVEKLIAFCEKQFGPEDPFTTVSIINLAVLHDTIGDYKRAEPLYERALKIREKVLGPEHADTITSLNSLAVLYFRMGDYKRAEPLLEQALKIREKVLGAEHVDTITSLNNLAMLYSTMGDYKRAEPLYERALKIREKILGPEHADTITSLNNLAMLYSTMGEYKRAETLLLRALKIREKVLGAEHVETAQSLNNLALLYQTMGDYKSAETLYERALKIHDKVYGPEHADTASSLNNLASLCAAMGDYKRAETLYEQALKIREKVLGAEHADTAISLSNLATLYNKIGEYKRAEILLERALKILEKVLGPEHAAMALSLNNLAALYIAMGEYKRAETLLLRALKIREKVLGPEHIDTAQSLNSLGFLYNTIGDYKRAETLYIKALKIQENILGPEHSDTAISVNNLAMLYQTMGEYKRAETLLLRALKIREKVLRPEHTYTSESLNNLAMLYSTMGNHKRAETLYERALKICEKALGLEHTDTANRLNNLAVHYYIMGDYKRAESLFERALKIFEKILGPEHADTARCLSNLSYLQLDKGDTAKAAVLARACKSAEEKVLANILSFTSERQRLAYQKTTHPYDLICTMGLAEDCAQAVLRHKGVVLDSLLEDMKIAAAGGNPEMATLVEKLRSMKNRMTKLMIETPKDTSDEGLRRVKEERERLEREIESTEGMLARNTTGLGRARRSLSVTVSDVQSVLPADTVLVEYIRYSHFLGKGVQEIRYGAVVITHEGEPQWVCLGKAEDLEEHIRKFQKLFGVAVGKRQNRNIRGLEMAANQVPEGEDVVSRTLRELCVRAWEPVGKSLPDNVKTVIVSPDGVLSFIPLAALLTKDDRFLGERYNIRYVSSGRDLLENQQEGEAKKPNLVAFGNPDFNASSSGKTNGDSGRRGAAFNIRAEELQNMNFSPLPGTRDECNLLLSVTKERGYPSEAHLGSDASESELRGVHAPRILHIATHGFFLSVPEGGSGGKESGLVMMGERSDMSRERVVNPMLRSGLALSGAEVTLEAWRRGENPDMENDGIVFASEVGAIDMRGTWLVVLSACETGLGEVQAGEGILGLRRGFVQAGATNLLMTLWSISDRDTVHFIEEFYKSALASGNGSKSLCEVQRAMLIKLRKEKGIWEAVYCAGPFVLTFQGRP